MGTSSMYGGFSTGSQGNPLLPNDFNDSNDDEVGNSDNEAEGNGTGGDDNDQENPSVESPKPKITSDRSVSWQTAKTSMSKVASGKSSDLRKAVSNYVKAHGGARSAAKTARSGVVTFSNIGNFVNSVASQGFIETLNSYKID